MKFIFLQQEGPQRTQPFRYDRMITCCENVAVPTILCWFRTRILPEERFPQISKTVVLNVISPMAIRKTPSQSKQSSSKHSSCFRDADIQLRLRTSFFPAAKVGIFISNNALRRFS